MSDLLTVTAGDYPPWQPGGDISFIEAYHVWDIPLFGHIRQGGTDYVFWSVDDSTDLELTAWAYARVDESELDMVKNAPDFDAAFERITAGKPLTVAFYSEDEGIEASIKVTNPAAYKSIFEAILDELKTLLGQFSGQRTPALAGVGGR